MKLIFLIALLLSILFYNLLNDEQKNSWIGFISLMTSIGFAVALMILIFGVWIMIDTTEAGAGSYPSAPENNEYKCYRFKAVATVFLEGYVYAKENDSIHELIESKKWEELENTEVIDVERILEIEKVDD